MIEKTLGSRLF